MINKGKGGIKKIYGCIFSAQEKGGETKCQNISIPIK
jgi:hypothetical protein